MSKLLLKIRVSTANTTAVQRALAKIGCTWQGACASGLLDVPHKSIMVYDDGHLGYGSIEQCFIERDCPEFIVPAEVVSNENKS